MNKKIKFVLIIFIVLIALGAGAFILLKTSVIKGYSMVYLVSGQAYVGKLSLLPKMQIKDAYLLETVQDPNNSTQANFQLAPLQESIWAPKTIYLNSKNVVFYGPIGEGSKVAEALRQNGK